MKSNLHPKYFPITAFCSCGNIIKIFSIKFKNIYLDICGSCHPFYTGKQRNIDSGGRIEKFNKKFNI
ncbi:50S ribosomal protein L31 [Buchnera aphidicola (Mollitrichosiphum nigrofasciatum)]|uniref:50S ribosomal protein L31 n=1 Tax=Buchnera aphidicola TaxID=9 RepID=UPI0031B82EF3